MIRTHRLLLPLLALTALSSSVFPVLAEPPPFTIGLAVCLSGPCANDGENGLNGARLAVEDINASGGVLGRRVELAVEDTQDAITGAKAVTAYYALRRNRGINLIVGPSWTPGLLAVAPVASKDPEVVMVTNSGGVREFHEGGKNLFNVRGVDEATTRRLARLAYAEGARSAAILGSQQAWELAQGEFFEEEFQRAGGKIAIKLEPIPSLDSLRAEALKIVTLKPDAVLLSAYTQLDLALRALQELRYPGRLYVAFMDESRVRLSGSAIEGVVSIDMFRLSREFGERLKRTYPKTEPFFPAYTAYDAVMLYRKAIVASGSFEAGVIASVIPTLGDPDAKSGSFRFDGGRLAVRDLNNFVAVKNGSFVPYESKEH